MVRKTVVIWGAGRIGRGFVADLFSAAGYHMVLIDQSASLIEQLRQAGQYTVVQAKNAKERSDRIITGYTALLTAQEDSVAAAVAATDSMALAVFPQVFPAVARQLAAGLRRRQAERPDTALDIILCTNLSHAAGHFGAALREALPEELRVYAMQRIGLVESLVIRMVADPPAELQRQEPLLVWTNGFSEFPVDRQAFKGPVPPVPGLRLVDDMRAEEKRKMYTYNMCHAVLAYQGARRGHTRPVDCLADPVVRAEAEGALAEVSQALQLEYGFGAEEMARWNEGVLRQTDNPTLGDTVARHGADPRRKLKRSDRLVGPLLLARKHGVRAPALVRAIAAALLFQQPGDPGADWVQSRLAAGDMAAAVRELCELVEAEEDLVAAIVAAYERLRSLPH